MIKETLTLDETISFLNSLVEIDAPAMQGLLAQRVQCGEEMANHPSVQCGFQMHSDHAEKRYQVGVLGLLNGIFGAHPEAEDGITYGAIAAQYEGGKLLGFQRFDPGSNSGQVKQDLAKKPGSGKGYPDIKAKFEGVLKDGRVVVSADGDEMHASIFDPANGVDVGLAADLLGIPSKDILGWVWSDHPECFTAQDSLEEPFYVSDIVSLAQHMGIEEAC